MTKHVPSIWHENLKMPENNLGRKFYSQTSCRVNDLLIYNLGFLQKWFITYKIFEKNNTKVLNQLR